MQSKENNSNYATLFSVYCNDFIYVDRLGKSGLPCDWYSTWNWRCQIIFKQQPNKQVLQLIYELFDQISTKLMIDIDR